jgi:hypothetical protein
MDSWVPNPTDRFENKNGGQENLKIKKKFKFSFSREKVTKKITENRGRWFLWEEKCVLASGAGGLTNQNCKTAITRAANTAV